MKRIAGLASILAGVLAAGVAYGLARPILALEAAVAGGAGLAALLTAAFMAGRSAASIASGVLAEKTGDARPLLAGPPLLLSAALLAAVPLLPAPHGLLAVSAIWGLLSGLAWPASQVAVVALASKASAGKMLAAYFALGGLGVGAGGKLLAELEAPPGELLPLAAAILALAAALVALGAAASRGLAPSERRSARGPSGGGGEAAAIALATAAALAAGALTGVLSEFYYAYTIEALGWSREELGNAIALAGALEVAASLAAGAIMDRLGLAPALTATLAVTAAASTLLALDPQPHWYAAASAGARATLPITRNAAAVEARGGLLLGLSNAASNMGMTIAPIAAAAAYSAAGPIAATASLLALASILGGLATLTTATQRGRSEA